MAQKIFTAAVIANLPELRATTEEDPAQIPIRLKLFQSGYTAYIMEATAYLENGEELSLAEAAKRPGVDLDSLRGLEDILMFGYVEWMECELGDVIWRELRGAHWPPFGLPIERDLYFEGTLAEVQGK